MKKKQYQAPMLHVMAMEESDLFLMASPGTSTGEGTCQSRGYHARNWDEEEDY